MDTINKLKRFIIDRDYRFVVLSSNRFLNFVNDEYYLKRIFKIYLGYDLNLKNPRTFNEKIQWLKINDHNPLFTKLVDKYEAKLFVSQIIGNDKIIPTLFLYGGVNDIDFEKLPSQFVLKATHDSGGLVICRDKECLDIPSSLDKLKNSLDRNFYYLFREWAYKNVKPRIIAEKYMESDNNKSLVDYKFFCFNGVPRMLYVSQGMEDHSTARISFFDLKGKLLPFYRSDYKPFDNDIHLPNSFDEMISISSKLAKNIPSPFVRIDLYEINGKVYFSEITFYPNAGLIPFIPREWDLELGNLIKIH